MAFFNLGSIDGRNHALAVTITVVDVQAIDTEQLKVEIRKMVFPLQITYITIETIVEDEYILR